ncbi:hypothetical protein HDV02_005389 [Globomyces sp. JEL0801]|nr:hypothetical protein HDV02_005389 [Globomyces sp. JEL0801]
MSKTIPLIDDFHVHLRQGALMKNVTPLLSSGGCRLAYALVMPNLKPPITTTDQALEYKQKLVEIAPEIEFIMTLYLNPDLTVEEIHKAAKAGIKGVKSYPRGVTTNSDGGIESYTVYYPIFEAMQQVGMVLNLHGEIPSDPESDVCVLNAEAKFLKHLIQLHKDFPKLKIVLEHATSKDAVDVVKSLGDTVGCTITVHHLELIVDDWAVAKFPRDREALRNVIKEGHPRFFLGTDSAPHPRTSKETSTAAAGVYTTPYVALYLVSVLESFGALDKLEGFASRFGRAFYGFDQPASLKSLELVKKGFEIPKELPYVNDEGSNAAVVPFLAGKVVAWSKK